MSPVNYTFGPPGLNNLGCQWFSNLHFNSGVLPVISERMLNLTTNLDVVLSKVYTRLQAAAAGLLSGLGCHMAAEVPVLSEGVQTHLMRDGAKPPSASRKVTVEPRGNGLQGGHVFPLSMAQVDMV